MIPDIIEEHYTKRIVAYTEKPKWHITLWKIVDHSLITLSTLLFLGAMSPLPTLIEKPWYVGRLFFMSGLSLGIGIHFKWKRYMLNAILSHMDKNSFREDVERL